MEKIFVSHTEITKAQQIIDIIEPIPANKFVEEVFVEKKWHRVNGTPTQYDTGRSCFLGHIGRALAGNPSADYDGFGARELTAKFLKEKHNLGLDGADVNNNPTVNGYIEPEIKDRIMHLLNDMKEAGY